MVSILHAPGLYWILSAGLLRIAVTGRRTGRTYTIPVGYQRCGNDLVVLVSKATRKNWRRNYEQPRALELRLHGRARRGAAHLVASESKEFGEHAERTFRRLPGIARTIAFLVVVAGCGTSPSVEPGEIPPPCAGAAYPACNGECPIGTVCATDSDWPERCTCIVDWEMSPR